MIKGDTRVEQVEGARRRIHLTMEISHFHLPPVESALVVGKRAGIGPRAMEKALAEILPETFQLIEVEDPIVEAIIVRRNHLRLVPEEKLIELILRNAAGQMEETEMLHFEIDVRVRATEEIEV